jgi:hypothetical protein
MKNTPIALLLTLLAGPGQAATVTPQVVVRFDGAIAGNTYTLGSGELDTTSSFTGIGNPAVGGGIADLDQNGGLGVQQGFEFNPAGIGSLTATSWVAETRLNFDSFGTGQLTAISVQGDVDFRILVDASGLQAGYWDGSTFGDVTISLPAVDQYVDLALVWDAPTTSLTAYFDGTAIGTINNNAFATPDTSYVSFGYFGRAGFEGRSIDGQLEAVAFSTFTGTFDPNTDFQVIPEPSAIAIIGLGGIGLLRRRRS